MVVGGLLGSRFRPGRRLRGIVAHLVGGLVLGIAAADLMPAASKPPSKGPVCVLTRNGRMALGLEGRGGFAGIKLEVAQMPIRTQGTQTIIMKIGCATTGNLKLPALRAVSQCWKR